MLKILHSYDDLLEQHPVLIDNSRHLFTYNFCVFPSFIFAALSKQESKESDEEDDEEESDDDEDESSEEEESSEESSSEDERPPAERGRDKVLVRSYWVSVQSGICHYLSNLST